MSDGESAVVAGIGELLWDLLPSDRQLGGAPFNFVRHCRQLGLDAFPVSCLGMDELGEETLVLLESWNVDTRYISWDPRFPRACSVFAVKSKQLPSHVVFQATGKHCPSFERTPRIKT